MISIAASPNGLQAFHHVFPETNRAPSSPQVTPYIGAPASPQPTQDFFNDAHDAFDFFTNWLAISNQLKNIPPRLDEALDFLIDEDAALPRPRKIVEWFTHEIREHATTRVIPTMLEIWSRRIIPNMVHSIIREAAESLRREFDLVAQPLRQWLYINRRQDTRTEVMHQLYQIAKDTFLSTVIEHLPHAKVEAVIGFALHQTLREMTTSKGASETYPILADIESLARLPDRTTSANYSAIQPIDSQLARLGQRGFARVVQAVLLDKVQQYDMRVDWSGNTSRSKQLRSWVEVELYPAVHRCLNALTSDVTVPGQSLESYQKMAINILGQSRLPYMLDYIQRWPNSTGAILELKEYGDASRENKDAVRAALVSQMETRLLHAGATTAELLGIYVKLIHVCFTLSPQGILLERVASPLRSLLRERPDTVKVIASSFLAELDENDALLATTANRDEVCPSITYEVQRSESLLAAPKAPLDWADMTWQPDPIDAGPDHRLTRHNDVVHFTLSLFERDAFIKEIESILGERLLRSEDETLAIETRLVDMLKNRLGDDRMQAADVMLRDMRDSVRIGTHISSVRSKVPRAEDVYEAIPEEGIGFGDLVNKMRILIPANQLLKARFAEVFKEAAVARSNGTTSLLFRNPDFSAARTHQAGAKQGENTAFEAKVLSAFFWPKLRDDAFKVPQGVRKRQEDFEREFKAVKRQRRLEWLTALGRSTVEVELKDRTVKVDGVKTWVAAVIDAFQTAGGDDGMEVDDEEKLVRKSVEGLEEELQMDEVLVRNALSFWTGQRVLKEVEIDVFEVLETLPAEGEEDNVTTSAPQREDKVSALKSKTAVLEENKQLYEMFIIGMLTNGGSMDPMRIAMMLNIAMPNGFGYGNDEVLWLLQGMEADGKVEKKGDAWAIKK
ncbi:cullin-like protein 1 [Elsinoe australis]|uniref:Anaphase-promoting complex subunit 2 n=1 Tax=Elsinoe australis TaxID=40998 RepID=A0A4V6DV78_9PEZI|nr:cullin-like protein 1 [Elsinoe australis]